MGYPGRCMEDSGAAEDHVEGGGPSEEVSEEKSIRKSPKHCSCDILLKDVIGFGLLKMSKAKLKHFDWRDLAEEILS